MVIINSFTLLKGSKLIVYIFNVQTCEYIYPTFFLFSLNLLPKNQNKMIVCHCNGVTEKEIVRMIKRKGATKLEHIQKLTGAGTNCGKCIPVIDDLLEKHKPEKADPQLTFDF